MGGSDFNGALFNDLGMGDSPSTAPPTLPSAIYVQTYTAPNFGSPGPLIQGLSTASLDIHVNGTRFRIGDMVTVSFQAPEVPRLSPVLVLANAAGVPLSVMLVPITIPSVLMFSVSFQVPAGTALGTLSISVSFAGAITGNSYAGSEDIVLVAGGDSGGRVISLASITTSQGTHMIAHLDSGRLVQGVNPQL